MAYCIYLRKSRADLEAEAHGEGETLARHEKTLLELAKRNRLAVTEIYREIVSGERIANRPVMQELLNTVEQGAWEGVLVMEVERLARGDTVDQGIVAQTFKFSGTKIITPVKVYDPGNEFDEEYFEFGLFMSRREYKTINRRLQRGRVASVMEGKYVSNKSPYGYRRVKLENDKGWTLEIIPEEANIIQLIYNLYTDGETQPDGSKKRLGVALIVRRLNAMNVPTKTGGDWVPATIRDILINPVYCGKIRWNWRSAVKRMQDGKVITERPRTSADQCIVVDGLHPAIISQETFDRAQELISKNPPRPVGERFRTMNPLAGLVVCGKCGRKMIRRPAGPKQKLDVLMCAATSCSNVSSYLYLVEERILQSLTDWLPEYRLRWETSTDDDSQVELREHLVSSLEAELAKLHKQLDNVHTLLEQGVYSVDIFLDRSRLLNDKIQQTEKSLLAAKSELESEVARKNNRENIVPQIEKLLDVYRTLPDAASKNDMLKLVLEKVVYTKEHGARWHGSQDDFELVLYPRLPSK